VTSTASADTVHWISFRDATTLKNSKALSLSLCYAAIPLAFFHQWIADGLDVTAALICLAHITT
jgi:hypothetical protein